MLSTIALVLVLAAEPSDEVTARAKEHFTAAQSLYKKTKYADAIREFEEAYRLKPHSVIVYNLARCHEQLGENGPALRAYRDYLRMLPNAPDKQQVSDAIANLERRLRERGVQQVLIFTDPESATVEVDGKKLKGSPGSVELPAGTHQLKVAAPGFVSVERAFTMSIARASEMTVNLDPIAKAPEPPLVVAPSPPPPPTPPLDAPPHPADAPLVAAVTPAPPVTPSPIEVTQKPPAPTKRGRFSTWIAAGSAVVLAGTGVGLGVGADSAASALRASEHPKADAQTLADRANGMALGANAAYGLAGAALVAAAVCAVVEAP